MEVHIEIENTLVDLTDPLYIYTGSGSVGALETDQSWTISRTNRATFSTTYGKLGGIRLLNRWTDRLTLDY